MTGKWHLRKNPLDFGFDPYFGHLSGFTDYIGGDATFKINREEFSDFGNASKEFYTTNVMTDYAVEYINNWEKQDDKPFALYIAYNAPHSPLQAPKELIEKYRGKFMKGWKANQHERYKKQKQLGIIDVKTKLPSWPDHHRKWDGLSELEKSWEDYRRAIFAAMIESLDTNIGRLKDELIAKDEWDNTVFLFFSDNGSDAREINRNPYGKPWESGYHIQVGTEWAGVGNTPFRWYKQNQHEGGISSPMIISWPRGLKARGINNFRTHIVDVYPTLLNLAQIKYPKEFYKKKTIPLAGESFVKTFTNIACKRDKPIYLKYETNKGVIKGNMKLVSARNGPWELYDLESDPTELHDLINDKPKTADKLKELFLEMLIKDGYPRVNASVNDFIAPWGIRSWTNGKLKAGDQNTAESHPKWKAPPHVLN